MSEEKEGQPQSIDFDLNADYAFDQLGKNIPSVPIQPHSSEEVHTDASQKAKAERLEAEKKNHRQLKQMHAMQELIQQDNSHLLGENLGRLQQVRAKKEKEKNRVDVDLPEEDMQYHLAHFFLYGVYILMFLSDFVWSSLSGHYLKNTYFFLLNLSWLFLGGVSLEKISHWVLSRQGMTRAESYYIFGWGAGIFLLLYVIFLWGFKLFFIMGQGASLIVLFMIGWVSLISAMRFRGHYDWSPSLIICALCSIWMLFLDIIGTKFGRHLFS